jgi:hypothetical protein
MPMGLRITNCIATTTKLSIFFSEQVDTSPSSASTSALNRANYQIQSPPGNPVTITGTITPSFDDASVTISVPSNALQKGMLVAVTVNNVASAPPITDQFPAPHGAGDGVDNTFATRVNAGDLKIVNCVATPDAVAIFLSESVDQNEAQNHPGYYNIECPLGTTLKNFTPLYDPIRRSVTIAPNSGFTSADGWPLTKGSLLAVLVNNLGSFPAQGDIGVNHFATIVNGGDVSEEPNGGSESERFDDLEAYPVLTEEVGYPPSPIAAPAGMPAGPPAQTSLANTVDGTLRQLLGWKINSEDPKGFVGALNASFQCKMVEGRTECSWTPRTYAVQTDLSGGITGAQASLYSRTKDAVDKSLPVIDGLYSLDEEAKPEDIQALKAVARTQLTELAVELGIPGGPRIQRINQLFGLLLGGPLNAPPFPPDPSASWDETFWLNPQINVALPTTNPDFLDPIGTLGNLRDELGLSFLIGQTLVNTIQDEQNASNFRIVSDYITSLAQSWLNNLQYFLIPGSISAAPPFFGTLLVLLSRQLSVITEKVNEVRFTLDSVFIGPSERQSLMLTFPPDSNGNPVPQMFLEDLLSWIENFATQEGPDLIQQGGRYAVGASFTATAGSLLSMVEQIPSSLGQEPSLPAGFFTARVQRSLQDLTDQLQQLLSLTSGTNYQILPEPQSHGEELLRLKIVAPPSSASSGLQRARIPLRRRALPLRNRNGRGRRP